MASEWGQLNGASVGIDLTNPLPVQGSVTASGSVSITGTVATKEVKAGTGTPTQVGAAVTNTLVLAANANRLGATIVNDSTSDVWLLLETAGTASSTVYTVHLPAAGAVGAYYELPAGYTGAVYGIWTAANGNAVVTEFSA